MSMDRGVVRLRLAFFFWRLYLVFRIHKLGSFVIRAYISYIVAYKLKMFYLLSHFKLSVCCW